MDWKHRETDAARKALSNFCKAVGTAGDHTVHIFTIPVDQDRDADMILSDVISERDALLLHVKELTDNLEETDKVLKNTFLQVGEATKTELDRWTNALRELGFTVHPGISVPENLVNFAEWWKDRRATEKPKC